jgi:hypothetical protein
MLALHHQHGEENVMHQGKVIFVEHFVSPAFSKYLAKFRIDSRTIKRCCIMVI